MNKVKIKDIDFEIQFYEGIIKDSPNFFEALSILGDLYTKRGLYKKGLAVDQKLAYLRPDDPVVLYNLSCSFSLLNEINSALRTIKRAINKGYSDFKHLEKDSDLLNLRMDSRFKRYFTRVKKKI